MTAVLQQLGALLVSHASGWAPPLAVYVALHVLFQYIVPACLPSVYDALGARKRAAGGPAPSRAELARVGRNALVASAMAVYVSALSIWGLLQPSAAALRADLYAETALTRHLVNVAVAFFLYDCVLVPLDGAGAVFAVHGAACLFVFVGALHPFLHYMAMVVLLFEASTPFLHARAALIDSGRASGAVFALVQGAFAATFIAVRIVVGWSVAWWWWWAVEALLARGAVHDVAIVRAYQAMCLVLSGLNGWWASAILAAACGGGRKGAKRAQGQASSSSAAVVAKVGGSSGAAAKVGGSGGVGGDADPLPVGARRR